MRLRLALALSLVLAASAWAAEGKKADSKKPDAPPPDPPGLVRMTEEQQKTIGLASATARRQAITEPLRLPGTVAFDPGHVALLRPLGQARVVRLLVQPGEVVAAGQGVVEVEMPQLVLLQQDLAAARAGIRESEAGVSVARAALDRAVILARDGSMARAEADRRRLVLAQAVAAEQTNRAKLTTLETQIARLNPIQGSGLAALRSPISGIVVASTITAGEAIDTSTDAITVADLHTVLVMAQIPESEAAKVGVSDPAKVSVAGNDGRSWQGRVATLGAQLNPDARTLPARIVIDNPDMALRAGMYVDVVITRALGRDAVVVPASAVQLVADKHIVFTPEGDDKFQSHEVQVGVQRQDTVEIQRGIKPDEQIVTQGSFELKALLQKSMLGGG